LPTKEIDGLVVIGHHQRQTLLHILSPPPGAAADGTSVSLRRASAKAR
jgi:hypothetical protein